LNQTLCFKELDIDKKELAYVFVCRFNDLDKNELLKNIENPRFALRGF
jgi:hypothetical protein